MPIADYSRQYIGSLSQTTAGVAGILEHYGDLTLREYTQRLGTVNKAQPLQARDDLIEIACAQTQRLLGKAQALKLRQRLEQRAVVLTANHHGVDYHPIYVQGSLVFALPELLDEDADDSANVVPVFSFGSISLNNATFPRGILLHPNAGDSCPGNFCKINLFPDHNKQVMVSKAPPITEQMIGNARRQIIRLQQQHQLRDNVAATLESILDDEYLDSKVLAAQSYSDQATLLNASLWRRLFADAVSEKEPATAPEFVYLEIESMVS
ncbi:MAG: hypothetical protein OET90_06690, partial [Desulfuromonadales bacterium]|nr:hypothetical protein [Desulfuromonadales bacterium]